MPGPAERALPTIEYRDRHRRVWYVAEVARFQVVSPAIDGPNLCLVIRFEREGEERFARWIGGEDCRLRGALPRLFAEAEPVGAMRPAESTPLPILEEPNDAGGVGPAPLETIALWVDLVATMALTSSRTSRSGRSGSGTTRR